MFVVACEGFMEAPAESLSLFWPKQAARGKATKSESLLADVKRNSRRQMGQSWRRVTVISGNYLPRFR